MRIPRVYIDQKIISGEIISIPADKAHHVMHVLRLRVDDQLTLFNNSGFQFDSHVVEKGKKTIQIRVGEQRQNNKESSLDVTICLAVTRGQRMDFSIQKAVELGVRKIIPVISEFSNVKLVNNREDNKLIHWKKIIIGATEQCGRSILTELESPITFDESVGLFADTTKILLHPDAEQKMSEINIKNEKIIMMSGPEGGFSDDEFKKALDNNYTAVNVGPRVLRAETAVVCGLSIAQQLWGDLN